MNDEKRDTRKHARELVDKMTLEEKASLCSGRDNWNTKSLERLGIPSIMMTDGPHGLRKVAANSGVSESEAATCFPTAAALASTWDPDTVGRVGSAMADEARAQGVSIILGPGANIKRCPLGGRNFEYYSEDPVLAGEIAAAFIGGVQARGIGTSLKHYAANNQETGRMSWDARVPVRALREIYLRAFEIAVKKAQPKTLMCAYNQVNGEFCSQNAFLLRKVLKEEWGFRGIVMSDWGAVEDRAAGVAAGLHLQMPYDGGTGDREIVEAVRAGSLNEDRLDEVVTELVALVLELAGNRESNPAEPAFDVEGHHRLAVQAAADAAILMKNENGILPLNKPALSKLAVIGLFAKEPRIQGHGSSRVNPTRVDIPYDEILRQAGPGTAVSYSQGYDSEGNCTDEDLQEAVDAAEAADTAILFAGLPSSFESEGFDRRHMDMPEGHVRLIREVSAVQPRTVVVLQNGSPVTMDWIDAVPGVLETWMSGQGGGAAVAAVLFGDLEPGGRLPETFPMRIEDTPTYLSWPGESRHADYGEGVFVGYRYYEAKDIETRFPFGFGLSYTSFEYHHLAMNQSKIYDDETFTCRFSLRNSGSRPGRETVQLYVSPPGGSPVQRPPKELKAFTKVSLEAGEEREVSLRIPAADLAYFDEVAGVWTVQPGSYELKIGSSSADIRLRASVTIESRRSGVPAPDRYSSFKEWLEHPVAGPLISDLYRKMLEDFGLAVDNADTAGKKESADAQALTAMFAAIPVGKLVRFSRGTVTREMIEELILKLRERTES